MRHPVGATPSSYSERSMNLRKPSVPALDALIARLQLRLNARATAATREWWTKYLRGAASFRGVKMGDVRAAVHTWFEEEHLGLVLCKGARPAGRAAGRVVRTSHLGVARGRQRMAASRLRRRVRQSGQ